MGSEPIIGTRKRSGSAPRVAKDEGPNREKILFFVVAAAAAVAGVLWWFLREPPKPEKPIPLAHIEVVRSSISGQGDSLEMVVAWELSRLSLLGAADSVRVEVAPDEGDTLVTTQAADQKADTVHLLAPSLGKTVKGYSCVAAHYRGEPPEQRCTPWQYVRPAARPESTSAGQFETDHRSAQRAPGRPRRRRSL